MADIFREIDEELQQEKAAKLWKRYGPYVIALAVLVIAAVAGYRFWQSYEADQRAAQSARYEAAARAVGEDPAAAAAGFGALAGDSNAGYAALASLRQAAASIEAGDTEGGTLPGSFRARKHHWPLALAGSRDRSDDCAEGW